MKKAMRLMGKIDSITEQLPQLDCGSCGAPSCRALAEDIVHGLARETDCIFLMRRQIQDIASQLFKMEGLPGEEIPKNKKETESDDGSRYHPENES